MRKALSVIIVMLLAGALVAGGLLWYIFPEEQLDLTYDQVPLSDRAVDMVKRLSPELVLSENDVNNLLIQSIASRKNAQPEAVITGARFQLLDGRVVANVNVKVKNLIPVGMRIVYRLEWQEPNLIATVEEANVKKIAIPAELLENVVIPLGEELPTLLKVKDVRIGNGRLTVEFRKPTISELKEILE